MKGLNKGKLLKKCLQGNWKRICRMVMEGMEGKRVDGKDTNKGENCKEVFVGKLVKEV